MNFVPRVPDELVTRLMYRHMPSWHAAGCYFDWRLHYREQQLKREGIGRIGPGGAVLTEQGWLIPTGRANPRVIESSSVPARRDREQDAVDAEVRQQEIDHEAAILDEDMAVFVRQWRAVIEGSPSAYVELRRSSGRSEEREAFMARWHADHQPH